MKRICCLLICGLILISLSGCPAPGADDAVSVSFYYLRTPADYVYGSEDGVITGENREISGHEGDLRYLLTLYLQGPLDENLQAPFPDGCRILELQSDGTEFALLLNSNFSTLKDMDLTLACVCIAKTCFSLTDAQSIRIMAESFTDQIAVDQTIHMNSLINETSKGTTP